MPRPKSGNPLWEPVAFKLPKDMLTALRRFADLHRMNISEVLREGLVLRLSHEGVVKEYNGYTLSVDEPGETDHTALLHEIRSELVRLAQVIEHRPAVSPPEASYGNTHKASRKQRRHPEAAQGTSATPDVPPIPPVTPPTPAQKGNTVLPEELPAYDPDRFVLGPLCQNRHDYDGQGHSLRQIGGKHECMTCKNMRSREYKQRKREQAQA